MYSLMPNLYEPPFQRRHHPVLCKISVHIKLQNGHKCYLLHMQAPLHLTCRSFHREMESISLLLGSGLGCVTCFGQQGINMTSRDLKTACTLELALSCCSETLNQHHVKELELASWMTRHMALLPPLPCQQPATIGPVNEAINYLHV